MSFVPTIGRIVHVSRPEHRDIDCRAAIVSGIDYGAGKTLTVYVSVFAPHNAATPVYNAVMTDPTHWHDPRTCPNETASMDRELSRALGE